MSFSSEFAPERLTAARKRIGLSQKRLAEEIGVSSVTVNSWERGRKCPHMGNVQALAEALGRNPVWFFGGSDEDPAPAAKGKRSKPTRHLGYSDRYVWLLQVLARVGLGLGATNDERDTVTRMIFEMVATAQKPDLNIGRNNDLTNLCDVTPNVPPRPQLARPRPALDMLRDAINEVS